MHFYSIKLKLIKESLWYNFCANWCAIMSSGIFFFFLVNGKKVVTNMIHQNLTAYVIKWCQIVWS